MFTNFNNQFGYTPSFNGYCTPFNQFGGFNYGFTPFSTPSFAPASNWQGGYWNTTPTFQTPSYGFNPWNCWTPGFAPSNQFSGFGYAPEFAYSNAWPTPSYNFAPVTGFATPWQGYAPQSQYGFNGSYTPSTNPWNYSTTGNAWNGVTNGQCSPSGYPTQSGPCRSAA
mgnify:FL=1